MTEPNSGARLNRRSLFGAAAATIGTAAVIGAAGSRHARPRRRERHRRASQGPREGVPQAGYGVRGGLPLVVAARTRRSGGDRARGRPGRRRGLRHPRGGRVTHSLRARGIEIDVAKHGWGSPAWVAGVKAALARAAERDVRDRHHRRSVLAGSGPDHHARGRGRVQRARLRSRRCCRRPDLRRRAARAHRGGAQQRRRAGHRAGPPRHRDAPHRSRRWTPSPTSTCPAASTGNRLAWTAPADPAGATWAVLATWRRGSGQEPEAGPHTNPRSYVVDHFSEAGTQAVIDLWEDRVLDGELRARLRAAGGYLFEDSLEIETEATIWTPRMLEEFEARARLRPAAVAPGRARGRGELPVRARHARSSGHDRRAAHQPGPRRLQPGALRPLPRLPPPADAGRSPAPSAWACGSRPTAWRPTPPSTPRFSTSPRPSRSASRTSTTSG